VQELTDLQRELDRKTVVRQILVAALGLGRCASHSEGSLCSSAGVVFLE
jgi:hypothetical protein